MPQDVQRGGEAEPDGPRKHPTRDTPGPREKSAQKPADRGEGKITGRRRPGKAQGE